MKGIFSSIILLFTAHLVLASCDTTLIAKSGWSIPFVDSEEAGNGYPGTNAIDGDINTFWHTEYAASQPAYPHEIQIDLGQTHAVNGLTFTPRQDASNGRVTAFEVYLSTDGTTWGTPEAAGAFMYTGNGDRSAKHVYFGAVDARYVKFVGTAGINGSGAEDYALIAGEIDVYEDLSCGSTGHTNQYISMTMLGKQYVSWQTIALDAVASSGLDVSYEVVSGPASVSGSTLTLTGGNGTVVLRAAQGGDGTYYSTEFVQSFEAVDLSTFSPNLSTRLTADYDIEMPSLHAYPIYAAAYMDEPGPLYITKVEVQIDGVTFDMDRTGDQYAYWWTPDSYGLHLINIVAYGINGNTTTINRFITVNQNAATQTVTTLNDVVIEYGTENSRNYSGTYVMPQSVGSYDQVLANLDVECPNGNCDDWDRWAYIDIKDPQGNWIQIIRYMTPYNVACNHSIDLTPYKDLLQGEVEFRVFIDTWGTGGWQLTLDLEYVTGTPDYLYTHITEAWDATYDLGNPTNLQPVDTVDHTFFANAEKSTLRVSNTGHGWGANNSQNAAEFYNATNYFDIDGTQAFVQNLWNDCDPNPDACTGQMGTWQYHRAGWCPGAIAHPDEYDITSQIAGGDMQLTYRFDPTYTDWCHPNNPSCVSGQTCTDCNDGYKAIYIVDGHIISESNTPFVLPADPAIVIPASVQDIAHELFKVDVYPNPNKGQFHLQTTGINESTKVFVNRVSGETVKTYYFANGDDLNGYTFDLSQEAAGIYFISVENNSGTGTLKLIVE